MYIYIYICISTFAAKFSFLIFYKLCSHFKRNNSVFSTRIFCGIPDPIFLPTLSARL